MYYFDNCATTPVKPEVLDLLNQINNQTYGNASSIYSSGKKSRALIEKARYQVASSIKADPEQIIFMSGGTEANNQVLWSLLEKDRPHVISNQIEHSAVNEVLNHLSRFGVEHTFADLNCDGTVSVDSIVNNIKRNTSLICLMMANNEIGSIQPLNEVVQIAKEKRIMVHTDAVQCMGKIELNVSKLGVDFLTLSAHKFYGPKGVGALYVRNPRMMNPLILGGGQERGLRAGTESVALIAGMGLACKIAYSNLNNHKKLLSDLETYFKDQLKKITSKVIFNGNQKKKIPGLINISFPGHQSNMMMAALDRADIAVSNGSACASGIVKLSPVLSALGLKDDLNLSSIRFSFGAFNTKKEIDYLIRELKHILN
jgi:cysteine desulfurase